MEKLNELHFKIGSNKNPIQISLKNYKGRNLIDIRKCFLKNNDKKEKELIPTRKGISLSKFQFEQMIEVLNSESSAILGFFEDDQSDRNFRLDIVQSTFGRSFKMEYLNDEINLEIEEDFQKKMGENNSEFFRKMLYSIEQTAHDILEDQDDIEMFLDRLNYYLNKTKW